MPKIINIGMNHETAPVALRECLAVESRNVKNALGLMRSLDVVREGFFLSTCNRVETLIVAEEVQEAKGAVVSLLSKMGNIPAEEFSSCLYTYENMDAVTHIFSVASSLDSMIIGEPQILGQIKEAYLQATREKMSGVILNRLMHKAFHVAKRSDPRPISVVPPFPSVMRRSSWPGRFSIPWKEKRCCSSEPGKWRNWRHGIF